MWLSLLLLLAAQRLAFAKHPVKGMPRMLSAGYWWAGVDSALRQEKPEARKMLARSVAANPTCPVHYPGVLPGRCVRQLT